MGEDRVMMRAFVWLSRAAGALVFLAFGSSALSAQFRDRVPPTPPTNLVVTATSAHSVTLSWGASTDNSGRFGYVVCCAGTSVTVSQGTTSHTLDGLQSGKTYVFRVYAKDAAGNLSKASNPVTVTLPGQVAAPTTPVVELVEAGPTHATLTWSSTDDGPSIWYTVYIDGSPVSTLNSRTGTFTCAAVLVPTYCDPLNQATTYTFTVRARDVDGNQSPVSDPISVTTGPADPADNTPPTAPGNVRAESNGALAIVSWNASIDNLAPAQFIRYDVYVNGELRRVVVGETSAEVEVEFGVNELSVVAVDTADNESEPGTISLVH